MLRNVSWLKVCDVAQTDQNSVKFQNQHQIVNEL